MSTRSGYCSLQAAVGWAEPCSGPACAFWKADSESCVLYGAEHELRGRPALAQHLLDLRSALEQRAQIDRSRFFHLLNEEQEAETLTES